MNSSKAESTEDESMSPRGTQQQVNAPSAAASASSSSAQQPINSVESELTELKSQLNHVEKQLQSVESDLEELKPKLKALEAKAVLTEDDKQDLARLRDEKKQLRDEKILLRDEKILLLNKEKDLRVELKSHASAAPAGNVLLFFCHFIGSFDFIPFTLVVFWVWVMCFGSVGLFPWLLMCGLLAMWRSSLLQQPWLSQSLLI